MATEEQIEQLRLILGDCVLTGEQLSDFIDQADGDLPLATTFAWTRLAADRVTMVNVSEAGSSRSIGDVFNNTLKMAEFHRKGLVPVDESTTTRRLVVRRIERE